MKGLLLVIGITVSVYPITPKLFEKTIKKLEEKVEAEKNTATTK